MAATALGMPGSTRSTTSERRCEFPTVAPGSEGQEHALGYAVFDEPSAVGSIPDGPVARIWLDHHVPLTFHRAFARG